MDLDGHNTVYAWNFDDSRDMIYGLFFYFFLNDVKTPMALLLHSFSVWVFSFSSEYKFHFPH